MLKLAIGYKDELEKKFYEMVHDDRFMFAFADSYKSMPEIKKDTWNKCQYVSMVGDTIIGYISYSVDRDALRVSGVQMMNFYSFNEGDGSDDKRSVFGKDVLKVFKEMLTRDYRKITFTAFEGNPIIPTYDKLVNKYGGRVVGIYKDHEKLWDGKYYDMKIYEIMQSDFINKMKG
jgi:hypothetical protein